MKAVRIHGHGGVAQLRYEDCSPPVHPCDDEALVELKAAALNRIDLELRVGTRLRPASMPRILGADGAGIVKAVGGRVQGLKPGDAVCLLPFGAGGKCPSCFRAAGSFCHHDLLGERADGTYAEYVRVPSYHCFPIPPGLSFEEAAALPLVYLMAWRMLVSDADLKPGEWVMIVGAGGGISTAALQLATVFGARVIVASRNEQKLAAARQLGAAHGIKLGAGDSFQAVRALTAKHGVDVAVNCIGGESWAGTLAALARGGRLVTCGALFGGAPKTDLRRVFWNHLRILAAHGAGREEFVRVLGFFAAGRHKPVIDSVFPLREAARAHERLERGEQFGKIVLRIDA